MRPESEWVVTEQPDLRIVPQELWGKVQERRKAIHLGQSEFGQKRTGPGPKYLVSGLLKCDECGSNFVMSDYYRYACGGHLNRGKSVCTNAVRVPHVLVEERCLAPLRDELFTPEALTIFSQETTRLLAERNRQREPELGKVQRQLQRVDGEIANIMKVSIRKA